MTHAAFRHCRWARRDIRLRVPVPPNEDDDQPWRDLLAATRADEMIASEGGEVRAADKEPASDDPEPTDEGDQ